MIRESLHAIHVGKCYIRAISEFFASEKALCSKGQAYLSIQKILVALKFIEKNLLQSTVPMLFSPAVSLL